MNRVRQAVPIVTSFLLLVAAIAAPFGAVAVADTPTASIDQVAVYQGVTANDLFEVYTNAEKHSAATHPASGEMKFVDPSSGEIFPDAKVGLELQGFYLPDGTPGLTAKVLEIQEGERIVLEWINFAWQLATSSAPSNTPSILTLEFRDNTVGAEIVMHHEGVPAYEVSITPSPFKAEGEVAPLSEIVRVHWELIYWQPMRAYLQSRES